jgi:hypothetical protein
LGITPAQANQFNNIQSTHTASIHQSASESAVRLNNRYGRTVNIYAPLEALRLAIQSNQTISTTPKRVAALNCLGNRFAPEHDSVDRTSRVSHRQLLALSWAAIQDNNVRAGTFEDALKQVIEGLYEIQRGYNISITGVDDDQADRIICVGGTFNKLIEKLVGIHPDAQMLYLTPAAAAAKFQALVKEKATDYLNEHESSDITDMSQVWLHIKNQVTEALLSDYGTMYPGVNSSNGNAQWQALLATHEFIPLPARKRRKQDDDEDSNNEKPTKRSRGP